MDKASVALSATEDNAAAIRELNKKLNAGMNVRFINGVQSGSSNTTFGGIKSSGNTVVIVSFPGTANNIKLLFANKEVNASASPILAILPKGMGELKVTIRSAQALIIG